MKRNLSILIVAVVAGLSFSFISSRSASLPADEWTTKTALGLYSMSVPNYMSATTELHEEASMQWNNLDREQYITVLDESKDDVHAYMDEYGLYDSTLSNLKNYLNVRYKMLKETGVEITEESDLNYKRVNGKSSQSMWMDAKVPGIAEEISYFIMWVEGKEHYYMITAWTLKSRKDAYKLDVLRMMNSFKELKKP